MGTVEERLKDITPVFERGDYIITYEYRGIRRDAVLYAGSPSELCHRWQRFCYYTNDSFLNSVVGVEKSKGAEGVHPTDEVAEQYTRQEMLKPLADDIVMIQEPRVIDEAFEKFMKETGRSYTLENIVALRELYIIEGGHSYDSMEHMEKWFDRRAARLSRK